MDILKRFDGKINGVLETFDRIIINGYIQDNDSTLAYLNSGQTDKGELARQAYLQKPDKEGLICAFSTVEPCKTITVKPRN